MLHVLYEDNHCLAVAKPAGVLTMGFTGAPETLIDQAREYVKRKYRKPGNVFLGVVHRLDKPVSGVVLFARTSKAAARLAEQFRKGTVQKTYWAVVEGTLPAEDVEWTDRLWKNPKSGKVEVVSDPGAGARPGHSGRSRGPRNSGEADSRSQAGAWERGLGEGEDGRTPGREARVRVRRLKRLGAETLVGLEPLTGRTHQLRVQLASRGLPIVGDRRYGAHSPFDPGIALHAIKLRFQHPTRHDWIELRAALPEQWQRRWPTI